MSETAQATPETSPPDAPAAPAARILVVDDDEANRDSLSRRLRRRGYETAVAEDGQRALDLLDAPGSDFDLVLLDVMMPGMSGLEVLEHVRKTRDATALPIIMATAKDQSEDIVTAFRLGASDYITKPIDFPVAIARVQTQVTLRQSVRQILALERSLSERNTDLESANAQLRTAADRSHRELVLASRVQEALLPPSSPEVPGFTFAWAFRPCQELAGDALNVCPLGPDFAAMYVLDVTGHGVAASLLSVAVARALSPGPGSLLTRPDGSPAPPVEVAARLDEKFPFDGATSQFFSMFYATLDVRRRELTYVSAGHPASIHVGRDALRPPLDRAGAIIGLGQPFEQHVVPLQRGDRVYVYSDGVSEAMNANRELFGPERLGELLFAQRQAPLQDSVARVLDDLERWRGGEPSKDDVSILAVECV